jgi:hypothetical protein
VQTEGEKKEKKNLSTTTTLATVQKTKIQIGTNLNSLFCFIASSLRAQRQRGFLSETTKATLPRATP